MIATLTLALVPALAAGDFEVEPKPLDWSALGRGPFDRTWALPEDPRASRDLLAEMRRLSTLQFKIDLGEGPVQRCFGDLVAMSQELDAPARLAWLNELPQRAPRLMEDWAAGLRELLLDERLFSREWEPAKDHERDGLLIAEDWPLSDAYGAPWSELKVDARFSQAAALFRADLATIKEVENDYRRYSENVGPTYETINPKRAQYFRGNCPAGQPFSTLAIEFRCDLPFPFSGYKCNLRILNRVDEDGIVRTDIYSTSRDFYYLAGRDVFLPIEDSEGRQVAFLVVRHFGFDLRGVPDKPKHRREGVRSSLGNLKRNAELRFREQDRKFATSNKAISEFRVLGRN